MLTGSRTTKTTIHLTWSAVTLNVNSVNIFIDQYKVYRAKAPTGTTPSSISSGSFVLRGTSTAPVYDDTLINADWQDLNQGYSFYYQISAADLCGNESARSDAIEIYCTFNGSISTNPADLSTNGGTVPMKLIVSGTDTYVRAKVHVPTSTARRS